MKLWDLERIKEIITEQNPTDDYERMLVRSFNRAYVGDVLLEVIIDSKPDMSELTMDEMSAILAGYGLGQYERKEAEAMGILDEEEGKNETIH